MVANAGLAHFVITQLSQIDVKCSSGYMGYLVRIALAIHNVYTMKGNLFLRLYECSDEKCLSSGVPHPITRKRWMEFYHSFVTQHMNLCLLDVGDVLV